MKIFKTLYRAFKAKLAILLISLNIGKALGDQKWDEVRFHGLPNNATYDINIGTGFYINEDTIVTNAHVVSDCLNIAIRGAVPSERVKLYLLEPELDIALLRSSPANVKVPYIRTNYDAIKEGDMLFSIGYPLEHGKRGEYIIKEAQVIKVYQDPKNKFSKIEFTDNVDHGNSGGPLLDKNSNLVGVVTAKHRYYDPNNPKITIKSVAAAISVEALQKFLKHHSITFASNYSYEIFTHFAVDNLTKHYVVNIHCVRQPLR